jgi:hypothetical protein
MQALGAQPLVLRLERPRFAAAERDGSPASVLRPAVLAPAVLPSRSWGHVPAQWRVPVRVSPQRREAALPQALERTLREPA